VVMMEETQGVRRSEELLDLLKEARREGMEECEECEIQGQELKRHLENHREGKRKMEIGSGQMESALVNNVEKDKAVIEEHEGDNIARIIRRMKRGRTEISEEDPRKKFKIENPSLAQETSHSSPPLRLKIKLTPDVTKSLSSSVAPTVSTKTSKVKFLSRASPEILVETLGVDVPSPRDLVLLNRLYHAPDAFSHGSTVRASSASPEYNCAVCDWKEESRARFQEHIVTHNTGGNAQCKECGACFAVEPSWRKHLFLIHRVKLPGLEDLCEDLVPLDEEERKLVIDTGEAEVEVLVCAGCKQNFPSQPTLEQHNCDGR